MNALRSNLPGVCRRYSMICWAKAGMVSTRVKFLGFLGLGVVGIISGVVVKDTVFLAFLVGFSEGFSEGFSVGGFSVTFSGFSVVYNQRIDLFESFDGSDSTNRKTPCTKQPFWDCDGIQPRKHHNTDNGTQGRSLVQCGSGTRYQSTAKHPKCFISLYRSRHSIDLVPRPSSHGHDLVPFRHICVCGSWGVGTFGCRISDTALVKDQ